MIIASWWPDLRSWPWSTPRAEKRTDGRTTPARPPRPNYSKIHANPLPVSAYPLPPLIPHNPLSVLSILVLYIRQLVATPSSHPEPLYRAVWSNLTGTVHVTDGTTMRALWEKGFFGKGSLSRSEPTWLEREKRKLGAAAVDTSEQHTRQRREDRRQFKNERAKKEREAIEERLRQETEGNSHSTGEAATDLQNGIERPSPEQQTISARAIDSETLAEPLAEAAAAAETEEAPNLRRSPSTTTLSNEDPTPQSHEPNTENQSPITVLNREHLQLTPEETFFLVYALGVLHVYDPTTHTPLSTPSLLSLFCSRSSFPPIPITKLSITPSTPFLISYVAYHHFRSLGWVVRPGIKFGVDYLLYQRGPAFAHAQFSVIVMPSYGHGYWRGRDEVKGEGKRSWWWLHAVNRVQSQVLKNLVIAFVEVPPPLEGGGMGGDGGDGEVRDVTGLLKRYKVREMVIKRWTPNRSRD